MHESNITCLGEVMLTEIEHMREALASYIEATYHLSNPKGWIHISSATPRLAANASIGVL